MLIVKQIKISWFVFYLRFLLSNSILFYLFFTIYGIINNMKKLVFCKKFSGNEKYQSLRFVMYTLGSLLLVFLLAEVILIFSWSIISFSETPSINKNISSNNNRTVITVDQKRLRNNYISQVTALASQTSQINIDRASYTQIRDDLLALSVPKDYLSWHFKLVISFDRILELMSMQSDSPSLEHEQAISEQARIIKEYFQTLSDIKPLDL